MINAVQHARISTINRFLLYVLIFFQPFNHFNSFREVSFYTLLVLFIVKGLKGELKYHAWLYDKTVIALFLLLGWALIVSLAGPYPVESLNAIRKNLLKQTVIFLVIISEFKNLRDMKPLLWVVVSSFTFVTLASIIENAVKDWHSFYRLAPSTAWRSTSSYFFANYADNAIFYLSFIIVWIVSVKESLWKKMIGAVTLTAGLVLVYIYNARTQFVTVFAAFVIVLIATRKYKFVVVFVIAMILCFSLLLTAHQDQLARYKSLLDPDTYVTDEGLTNRLGIWRVVIEFIRERPVTGYGYGWKKLAWLVQEKNTAEFWQERPASAYNYFVSDAQLMYGRVSPHNLALQVAFEIGIAGLAIYAGLWLTVLGNMYRIVRARPDPESQWYTLGGIGVIISYAIVNITNALWHGSHGMMIFLFMASILVIYRSGKQREL